MLSSRLSALGILAQQNAAACPPSPGDRILRTAGSQAHCQHLLNPASSHASPSMPSFHAPISQMGAELNYPDSPPHKHHLCPPPTAHFHNFSRKIKSTEKLPIGYLFEVRETGGKMLFPKLDRVHILPCLTRVIS